MRIGGVATALLFTMCLMISNACGADGEGGGETPAQPERGVLRGQVTFHPMERMFYRGLGDPCEVTGQYSYIRAGGQVLVKNAAETIIASGVLEPGITVWAGVGSPYACRFAFAVREVPTSDYYWIEVGDSGRHALGLSYDELESQNWTVHLGVVE